MTSVWVESLGRNLDAALDFMEGAVRDCPDELWEASMWPVDSPVASAEVRGADGELVTDPTERAALVQRNGTPWGVTWHALEVLDAKLNGGFAPWQPWPAFGGATGVDITTLSAPWSRADLLAYIDYCRQRVVDTLADLTDERAATVRDGRRGEPYAAYLMRTMGHLIEHAAQIRQFVTGAGVASTPNRHYGAMR